MPCVTVPAVADYQHDFHPWRIVRERLAEWHVVHAFLPTGMGDTNQATKTIRLHSELDQAGRRSTLAHEILHALRGDDGICADAVEARVDRCAARALMPIGHLGDILIWANSLEEAADELWVDLPMLLVRLDNLNAGERAILEQRMAAKEG